MAERERIKALERENRELRQADEIFREASAYFAMAELDRRSRTSSPSSTITERPTGSSRSAACYAAFVIDAFARRIVGWRASRTAHAGFVLDALDQALHERQLLQGGGLVHHSDSQKIEASPRAV
jgi:transposase InsO family protein